jgi:CheY-like chemotaxis protein
MPVAGSAGYPHAPDGTVTQVQPLRGVPSDIGQSRSCQSETDMAETGSDDAPPRAEESWTNDTVTADARIRLLIMDDQEDIITLLRITAELDGRFEVVGTAAEGAEAIELSRRVQPDVVILDHLVTGAPSARGGVKAMSGPDAIDVLRATLPGVFVVMYSGLAQESDDDHGVDLYAVKGEISPTALMAQIAEAVRPDA